MLKKTNEDGLRKQTLTQMYFKQKITASSVAISYGTFLVYVLNKYDKTIHQTFSGFAKFTWLLPI